MGEFTKIARLHELGDNKGIACRLEDEDVALIKSGGDFFAFINVCPHQQTPLVDKYGGQIAESRLTCPMHGWTYDLRTGDCVNASGKLKMLEVKIEDGKVFVRKPVRKQDW